MMRPSASLASSRLGSVVMVDDRKHSVMISTGLGGVELPDTIVSPGAVVAALDEIQAHVAGLQNDIASVTSELVQSSTGQRFLTDWNVFMAAWTRFYTDHRAGLRAFVDWTVGDTVAGMRQRASQFNAFEERFRAMGHEPTNVGNPNTTESWLGLPVAAWIGIGAGVVALGFVAWTASSVSKFAPVTRRMRGRR